MFNSFKNTELFRYFIRVDLNRNINKLIKQNKSNFSLISGSIFSGSFSVLGTYFGMHENKYNAFIEIIITSLLFSVLFIIGMFLFQSIYHLFRFVVNSTKKENLPNKEKIKEYIDDFDHIACDNILISQNFIESYNDSNISTQLKEFYFYEVIYYTDKSISIISRLFTNESLCINDRNNIDRVHLYRIENAIEMISEILEFVNSNKSNILTGNSMKQSLINDINRVEEKLNKLKSKCNKLKHERYMS